MVCSGGSSGVTAPRAIRLSNASPRSSSRYGTRRASATQTKRQPSAQTSTDWSYLRSDSCSGALKMGVPAIAVMLRSTAARRLAPKSAIFATGDDSVSKDSESKSTFAGLRSRWITAGSWECRKASALARPERTRSFHGLERCASSPCCKAVSRLPPPLYSISTARLDASTSVAQPRVRTTCTCGARVSSISSARLKLSSAASLKWCRCISFAASSSGGRPSRSHRAACTVPNAPDPTRSANVSEVKCTCVCASTGGSGARNASSSASVCESSELRSGRPPGKTSGVSRRCGRLAGALASGACTWCRASAPCVRTSCMVSAISADSTLADASLRAHPASESWRSRSGLKRVTRLEPPPDSVAELRVEPDEVALCCAPSVSPQIGCTATAVPNGVMQESLAESCDA
mmetsp:Transcript_36326/g.62390  ORF Transcript_36326/g.62390 Transcript_36326/m.62390 type:complete len:405 (-) Transcript_36326:1353-2567(-)